MLKKGIAAAALFAATSSVYAGGPEAPPPAYIGGAYVDVGLSRDDIYQNFRHDFTDRTITVTQGNTTISNRDFANRINAGAPGWDGLLGFGYTYVWDNEWTLGAEMFGDVTSANGTQYQSNTNGNLITGAVNTAYMNLRAKHTLGVSLMPGYFIAPGSLYFLELGYVNTEFALTGFPNTSAGSFGNIAPSYPNHELNRSGFRLGFGTNTQVGAHVAIRQEYVWETYGNFTVRSDKSVQNEGRTSTQFALRSARLNPNISKYNLAAVYYFARQGNAPDLSTAPAHVGGHFYAGLNGSYDEVYSHADFWRVRNVTTTNATGALTADGYSSNSGLMKITGFNLGLLGGYGWNFTNRWYLGAEIFGNYDNATGRYDSTSGNTVFTTNGTVTRTDATAFAISTRLQKRWDFGAALIPGYQVSDAALLYARVGYVGADFNVRNGWSVATDANFTPLNITQAALASYNRSKWLGGLQLGVGVDTLVYQNLSLRTEFNINNYGNYNVSRVVSTANANGATTVTTVSTTHRHLIEDQFNVALIWHFFG